MWSSTCCWEPGSAQSLTQKMYLNRQHGQDLLTMCRLFLVVIIFCLYCNRVEGKAPGEVSGDCFFYLLAVLLLICLPSSLVLALSLLFFLAAGICRGRDAAGASQAGIAVGYAEPVCVHPVLPVAPHHPCCLALN